MTPLLVALGAAVGAPLRSLLGARLDSPRFPSGTLLVNVVGSLLLGLFAGLSLGEHPMALLGTGFCGGFTTYSSFAVQTHSLGTTRGTLYAAATIVVSVAAAALGWAIAQA